MDQEDSISLQPATSPEGPWKWILFSPQTWFAINSFGNSCGTHDLNFCILSFSIQHQHLPSYNLNDPIHLRMDAEFVWNLSLFEDLSNNMVRLKADLKDFCRALLYPIKSLNLTTLLPTPLPSFHPVTGHKLGTLVCAHYFRICSDRYLSLDFSSRILLLLWVYMWWVQIGTCVKKKSLSSRCAEILLAYVTRWADMEIVCELITIDTTQNSLLRLMISGTRYKRRGIDVDGYVANYVETEQIIEVAGDHIVSFVQTRGSIPIYWSQPGWGGRGNVLKMRSYTRFRIMIRYRIATKSFFYIFPEKKTIFNPLRLRYRPPPRLLKDFETNHEAFTKHFDRETWKHKHVNVISLVDESGANQMFNSTIFHFLKLFEENLGATLLYNFNQSIPLFRQRKTTWRCLYRPGSGPRFSAINLHNFWLSRILPRAQVWKRGRAPGKHSGHLEIYEILLGWS